jgi:gliding motility-associated-like protein
MIFINKIKHALFLTLALSILGNSLHAQYCLPIYVSPCVSGFSLDYIDNFWTEGGITNISNLESGCSPDDMYDYTGMAVSGCVGTEITMNMQCEADPASYAQGFAVWIDWDNNEIFDADEKVYASPAASFEVFVGTFTIPPATPIGIYNMRVRCVFATAGAAINPCSSGSFGEAEDYLVDVVSCEPTICVGDTVTIETGTLPPAAGPYTYAWEPATFISDPFGGPDVDVWPVDTTTYTVTITSPDSSWTVDHVVNVNYPANPSVGEDLVTCIDPGVPFPIEGTVEIPEAAVNIDWEFEDFIGPPPYPFAVFSPDDDILSTNVAVPSAGIYEFVMYTSDISGVCPDQSDTLLVTFSEEFHELDSVAPSCFGGDDGSIIVTSTGLLGAVEYSIDGGATWQVSNIFTGLTAGTYDIISKDIAGCTYESSIEVINPDPIVMTVSSDTLICRNGTATLNAEAIGGTFTYAWSVPGADDGPTQTLSPTETPTVVTVTATNEFGCDSDTDTILVTLRDPITLTVTENDTVCPGYLTTPIVTAVGGDGAYNYEWTANGSPIGTDANSVTDNPEMLTIYCVSVNDGCETTPETICTETHMRPVPEPAFSSDKTEVCNPDFATFYTSVADSDSVIWRLDGRVFTGVDELMYEFTSVGFYDIGLEIYNEFGCHADITAVDYFESVAIPNPKMFINPNPTTIFNTEVTLTPTKENPEDTYEWFTPEGLPEYSTEDSPTIFFPEGVPGEYEITLVVTNKLGCTDTIKETLIILSDVIIYAPNVFTPDGDQYNEDWGIYIDGIDIYNYHMHIFNRWGEIVWESFDPTARWDGTYGSQGLVDDGTYVWRMTAKEATTDKILEFNGTITVLK